jgi:hypothetical protein
MSFVLSLGAFAALGEGQNPKRQAVKREAEEGLGRTRSP